MVERGPNRVSMFTAMDFKVWLMQQKITNASSKWKFEPMQHLYNKLIGSHTLKKHKDLN